MSHMPLEPWMESMWPPKSGRLYHNYKGFFYAVLMVLVIANYRFKWLEVGTEGSC